MAQQTIHVIAHQPPQTPRQAHYEHFAYIVGVLGFGALAYAVGRSSAPTSDCCDRLVVRDAELLICEQRLMGPLTI